MQALEGNGHGDEDGCHTAGRQHKHPSALEARDGQGDDHTVEQTPALVGNVDPGLCEVGGVTHHLEEQVGVVRKQSVSAHLGEETHHGRDEHTAAHTGRAEHVHPRLLGVLQLELDGGSNLGHLGLHNGGVGITFSVEFGKDRKCLILAILADKPPRAFREQAIMTVRAEASKYCTSFRLTRRCRSEGATGKSATEKEDASSSHP